MAAALGLDSIGTCLDEALDLAVTSRLEVRDQSYFHPSSIGQCPRRTVLERLEVPKAPLSPRIRRIFENGHAVHTRIQAELLEAGVLLAAEVPLHAPDHTMQGHADGLVRTYFAGVGGLLGIAEIKSANEKSFAWIAGTGKYAAHGPDPKHQWQVQLYCWMAGVLYGYILYENKNDQTRKSFVIKRDSDLITGVLLPRVDLINAHVTAKTLPPRDPEHQPVRGKAVFECTYCDVRQLCEREEVSSGVIDLVALGTELLEAS